MRYTLLWFLLALLVPTAFAQPRTFPRNVLVEEWTSSVCGFCPLGHVGMAALRAQFGERVIPLALHTANPLDPMYFEGYGAVAFEETPTCRVARGELVSPLMAAPAVQRALAQPALVAINLSAQRSGAQIEIEATVDAEVDGAHDIAFVLVADHLVGATYAWRQANFFSQMSYTGDNPAEAQFYKGGARAYNPYPQVFEDVVLASSYRGAKSDATLPSLKKGEKVTTHYRLAYPTRPVLQDALRNAKLSVVAIVATPAGEILNAARVALTGQEPPRYKAMLQEGLVHGALEAIPATDLVAGSLVTVEVTPDEGYRLVPETLYAYKRSDAAKTPILIAEREGLLQFTMPEGDVVLTAQFEKLTAPKPKRRITLDPAMSGGTLHLSPADEAQVGTMVAVRIVPAKGFQYKGCSLRYFKSDAPSVSVHFRDDHFPMPDYDVTVSAEFEYDPSQNGNNGTTPGGGNQGGGGLVTPPEDTPSPVEEALTALRIIPNPFTTHLHIAGWTPAEGTYQLYAVTGELLRTGAIASATFDIPTDSLPAGLYFLRLSTASGVVRTLRVVKR